jgi:hypothetical protein
LSSAPRSRRRHPRSFRPCRLSPSLTRRRWSFKSPTDAALADTADPAARATGLGAVPIRADIMDPIADLTGFMGDRGPETVVATGGIAVQGVPVIRLGEGPFPAAITAPIDTDRRAEKGPAPFLAEALREAPAFGSLRQVAFQAAIRRFSAFSASASASRFVAKDISERSWAWPERKSVQR